MLRYAVHSSQKFKEASVGAAACHEGFFFGCDAFWMLPVIILVNRTSCSHVLAESLVGGRWMQALGVGRAHNLALQGSQLWKELDEGSPRLQRAPSALRVVLSIMATTRPPWTCAHNAQDHPPVVHNRPRRYVSCPVKTSCRPSRLLQLWHMLLAGIAPGRGQAGAWVT